MMNRYSTLLHPGERVNDIPEAAHGSQEWAYGYNFGAIEENAHTEGNSVVLDIEPLGTTEPVLIVNDIVLSVKALRGTGLAVVYNIDTDDDVRRLHIDPSVDAIKLRKGDAYYYLNLGEDSLILRDDSTPAFQDGDEVLLTIDEGRKIALPASFWLGFTEAK